MDIGGKVHAVKLGPGLARVDDQTLPYWCARDGDQLTILAEGRSFFVIPDPLDRGQSDGAGGDAVLAPMPGLVRSLTVAPGDPVKAGASLGMMEAMKMELHLRAPRDGTVALVHVAEGAQVKAGALLIGLEPSDG